MSAPSSVATKPPLLVDSPICDDPRIRSEILKALCEKTLCEADYLLASLTTCIKSCKAVLDVPLIWADELFSPISEEVWSAVVSYSEPDSALDDTVENEFEASFHNSAFNETVVPETEGKDQRMTEVSGGGDGAPAAARVAETKEERFTRWAEDMYRIVLPRYFDLVRSALFPLVCCFRCHCNWCDVSAAALIIVVYVAIVIGLLFLLLLLSTVGNE